MTIILPQPEVLADQLAMPDPPHWHRDALYFSDGWLGRIRKRDARDHIECFAELP